MADTLESLEIKVQHNASGTDAEINGVATAIGRLKTALTGVPAALKELASAVKAVNDAFKGGTAKYDKFAESMLNVATSAELLGENSSHVMTLANAMNTLTSVKVTAGSFNALAKGVEGVGTAAQTITPEAISNLDKMVTSLAKLQGVDLQGLGSAMSAVNRGGRSATPGTATPLPAEMQEAIQGASRIDVLRAKLASLQAALQEAFASGNTDKAYALRGQIISTEKALESASKSARGTSKSFREMAKEAAGTGSPLQKLVSSLKRIAFYRIIRSIIKGIGQAFKEGFEAAYAFSAGIDGTGHRFAAAMDSIKSSGNAMKGQLGSAFIALYAAIAPVLIAIIDLVTRVADAISQLLSAFTGSTYLKANKTAAKFVDTMKAGGGAAKEWKNQLLGFDEINRLNEPNQGGGGGGKNPLEGFDFEESPIEKKWMDLANKIKSAIQWIQDHMDLIKGIALAIGGALAAWKIGSFLSNLTGIPGHMSTVLGLAIAIGGAIMFIVGACDAWKNGVDWDNMALMISGVAVAAIGLGLAFGGVAAAVVLLIGGIAMLVVGIRDWIKTGKLTEQTFWLIEAAIVAVTVALGILIGWPAALVGGFVAALGVIIYYWDAIIARIVTAIQAIKAFFSMKSINARLAQAEADGSIYLQGFASGGYPSEGQLFFANESGPEMVGTMGGRTAVANNDQIVEGIRQGVYDAVVAANANGNSDVSVRVYLDSREIRAGQERLARAWG